MIKYVINYNSFLELFFVKFSSINFLYFFLLDANKKRCISMVRIELSITSG